MVGRLTQKPPEMSVRSGTTVPKCRIQTHHQRFQIESEKQTTQEEENTQHTECGFDDNNSNDGNEEKMTTTTRAIEVSPSLVSNH